MVNYHSVPLATSIIMHSFEEVKSKPHTGLVAM